MIGVCYRSNNIQRLGLDTHKAVRDLVLEVQSDNLLMMGDFNYPDIDWDTGSAATPGAQLFLDCVEDGFLTQHVREPTSGPACLALVITKDPDIVQDLEV